MRAEERWNRQKEKPPVWGTVHVRGCTWFHRGLRESDGSTKPSTGAGGAGGVHGGTWRGGAVGAVSGADGEKGKQWEGGDSGRGGSLTAEKKKGKRLRVTISLGGGVRATKRGKRGGFERPHGSPLSSHRRETWLRYTDGGWGQSPRSPP